MSDSTKAVFLSYASQDAEAAKRIADALRAAGVEVWFDQSELVGGDAWDAKIRKQIKECALLIPIISTNTQSRTEGYFRLEWRLADQRTHLMGKGRTFLLPVCIDDTKDADADVPDSFSAVQWTKLKGGETPPGFAARVKKLLDGSVVETGRPRPAAETHNQEPRTENRRLGRLWWALPIFGMAMALLLVLKESRKEPPPPAAPLSAPAAPLSEARRLVAQARPLLEGQAAAGNPTRDDLLLAEDLCRQALKLDENDAVVWAAYAEVSSQFFRGGLDRSPERIELARTQAERAMKLAPQSFEARYAKACYLRGLDGAALSEAEKLLRELAAERPDAAHVLISLGKVIWGALGPGRNLARADEALAIFDRAAVIPGDAQAEALLQRGWLLFVLQRYPEAESTFDKALRIQPAASGIRGLKVVLTTSRGDLVAAKAALAEMSESSLRTDQGVGVAAVLWLLAREPDKCLAFMSSVSRDYVSGNTFTGTADGLRGDAYQLAGRTEAARNAWQTALRVVEKRLADQPRDGALLGERAKLLAQLGERDAAVRALKLFEEMFPDPKIPPPSAHHFVAHVLLDPPERAITVLESASQTVGLTGLLRLGYQFDPLRGNPRFEALLKEPAAAGDSSFAKASTVAKAMADKSEDRSGLPAAPDEKSVAVLAFTNLSDDKANEYFSDGISEELLNVLAKVPQLKVAARTSSFYFKGQNVPIPEIAQKLGVAYVVEGSVRKAGGKVRITAQLIKAADGFHVWSETYDRELKDIFAVQDEIAKNILGVVKGSLLGEAELPHLTTTKIEAYTLYLQAQGQMATRTDAGLHEAGRLFEATLAVDPDYVPAWVGLARMRFLLPSYVSIVGPEAHAMAEGARAAAKRALELDPSNAGALAADGAVLSMIDWRWSEGGAELQRALALAPNDPWVVNFLGDYYRFTRDSPAAIAAKELWWKLDPLNPVSHWDLGYTNLVAGNTDQAIHWGELAVKLAPHNLDPYVVIALAAGRAGRFDLMRRTLAAARQNVDDRENEGVHLLVEADCAILEKRPDEARRLLVKAAPMAESGHASPAYLGYCYLLLGESDQARVWLQRGFDLRDNALVWPENINFDVIAANPQTRPLLDQPGLKELYELRQRNVRAGLDKP